MKALHRFTVLLATAAFIAASVTIASAQNTKSSDLLTTKQVQELLATAKTPADHMKLSRHFTALAAKYETDAKHHDLVAAAYRKNPTASESKRPGAPDTALHCERLAQLARDSAKVAREVAAEHQKMADAK
jgi:hypothetical protein